jgi:hypothetical protein
MPDDLIVLNGINGATGDYYTQPMAQSDAAGFASSITQDPDSQKLLSVFTQQATAAHLGLPFDRDPKILKEAGWCVVFHAKEDDTVKKALQPLIEHRQKQIGDDKVVKVLDYNDGETVQRWLARFHVAPGSVDATKVPLYVLLIGSPEKIPFDFGHMLDVEYCVGRLHFDTPDGYAQYVQSVIDYETGATVPNRREVAFWAPRHINDGPTRLSADFLVKPLAQGDTDRPSVIQRLSDRAGKPFGTRYLAPANSMKADLLSLLRPAAGASGPAFLFTASHGMGWPLNHANQATATGALLCQDFPGAGFGPIQPSQYCAAADIPNDAHVHGLVSFHFACFGGGTPKNDLFMHKPGTQPPQIAPSAFISPLPKALLSHRNGGALAVIGHVERAWMSSIATVGAGVQLIPFENVLGYILLGLPVGYALKDFNERYAALSTALAALIEKRDFGDTVPDSDLATRWTDRNDAQSYTLLGDPGVRVRVNDLQ